MEKKNKQRILGRENLKSLFANGTKPDESNFESLINSFVNRLDDGISKTKEDGLILVPDQETSDKLMSFYKLIDDEFPEWGLALDVNDPGKGLNFIKIDDEGGRKSTFYLQKDGKIGVATTNPQSDLEVNGILGTKSRIGTYKIGTVPADGRWHNILEGLNGSHAFEIVAHVGKPKSGKHALLVANAVSTFGKSRSKIKYTQAHYGWWWNKMKLKWTGSTFDYGLKIRSKSNYGSDQEIRYCISTLWDNDIMKIFTDSED